MIENLRLAVEEEQRQTHDLLTTNVQLKKAVDDLTESNKSLAEEKNSEISQLRLELQKAEELNKGRFCILGENYPYTVKGHIFVRDQ